MDKRKLLIILMFLFIGAIAVFRTASMMDGETICAESVRGDHGVEWLAPVSEELKTKCGECLQWLVLTAVTLPFLITIGLLTANAILFE